MVQQQHGQAGFVALLSAASDSGAEGARADPAPIHGLSKSKRTRGTAPAAVAHTHPATPEKA